MWIVVSDFEGKTKVWSGNGFGTESGLFTRYESGDEAQKMADAFHLSDCIFNHTKARESVKKSRFVVRDFHSGERFTPKPLVSNKYIFDRGK